MSLDTGEENVVVVAGTGSLILGRTPWAGLLVHLLSVLLDQRLLCCPLNLMVPGTRLLCARGELEYSFPVPDYVRSAAG